MNKKITIRGYLKDTEFANKNYLLTNLFIGNVPVELFLWVFGNKLVDDKPSSIADFICDGKNAYELAVFGSRYNEKNRIDAYNGKSFYYGTNSKTTLGASHSNYVGNNKSKR